MIGLGALSISWLLKRAFSQYWLHEKVSFLLCFWDIEAVFISFQGGLNNIFWFSRRPPYVPLLIESRLSVRIVKLTFKRIGNPIVIRIITSLKFPFFYFSMNKSDVWINVTAVWAPQIYDTILCFTKTIETIRMTQKIKIKQRKWIALHFDYIIYRWISCSSLKYIKVKLYLTLLQLICLFRASIGCLFIAVSMGNGFFDELSNEVGHWVKNVITKRKKEVAWLSCG